MSQVFSRFAGLRRREDHPEWDLLEMRRSASATKGKADFVFPKRAKRIKIIPVEERSAAQRKLEQGHVCCPRRV
jgi:hypothetical protein